MGDLIGMPAIVGDSTVFRAPDWVPRTPGPGILLIDDVNRADDRILRGIMQLLQNFELVSWSLPPQWQIVLTANPDGGDYSVTPMDDAMLTRMMHITMKFNAKVWALWAEQSGVDPRGINFVLTYPEVALGRRTTPCSLVQFFYAIRSIHNLKDELALVQMLADSCLDDETAISFISYVQHNLSELHYSRNSILCTGCMAVLSRTARKTLGSDDTLGCDWLVGLARLNAVDELGIWIAGCKSLSCRALCGVIAHYHFPLGSGHSGEAAEGS